MLKEVKSIAQDPRANSELRFNPGPKLFATTLPWLQCDSTNISVHDLINNVIQEIKVDQSIISLVAYHMNGISFAQVVSFT